MSDNDQIEIIRRQFNGCEYDDGAMDIGFLLAEVDRLREITEPFDAEPDFDVSDLSTDKLMAMAAVAIHKDDRRALLGAHADGGERMSYCRFSSNDFLCDVYCYESVGDFWAIHVASRRVIYKTPLPPYVPLNEDHIDEYLSRDAVVMEMLKEADHVAIGLPHAGESFQEPTALAAAERLEYLRDLGYVVPRGAIDVLHEEALDGNGSPTCQDK